MFLRVVFVLLCICGVCVRRVSIFLVLVVPIHVKIDRDKQKEMCLSVKTVQASCPWVKFSTTAVSQRSSIQITTTTLNGSLAILQLCKTYLLLKKNCFSVHFRTDTYFIFMLLLDCAFLEDNVKATNRFVVARSRTLAPEFTGRKS